MSKDFKFKIGQTVIVIESGEQYSSWDTKASEMGLKQFINGASILDGCKGKIAARDIHNCDGRMIYGITFEDGSQGIFGENGLSDYSGNLSMQVEHIQISRTILNEYYDAATVSQRDYIVANFKLNGETTVKAIQGLCDIACGEWKTIIRRNHPECFPEEIKYFNLLPLVNDNSTADYGIFDEETAMKCGFSDDHFLQVRGTGEYENKGFYLHDAYEWRLLKDRMNALVLIPTKKNK